MAKILAVDDGFVVQVAEAINELVDEVLGFCNGELLPFFDEIEHVLGERMGTPWLQSYSSM